ncbi:MAG: ABC transporter ATP-binding protein [Candidatus Hodarchaeota archaeon]
MNSFQMIVKYWLKSKKKFWGAIVLLIISTIFTLVLPRITGTIIGRLTPNEHGVYQDPMTPTELGVMILFAVLTGFLAFIFNRQARVLNAEVAAKALYFIRKDIYDAIYSQSFAYFDKNETGQLVARATSDVDQTEMLFGFALNLGVQGIMSLFGVIFMAIQLDISLKGYSIGWIFYIFIPLSLTLSLAVASRLKPIFLETRRAFGELTNTLRENIVGAQVVRIFSTQEKEKVKFGKNNVKFRDWSIRSVKYTSLFFPILMCVVGLMFITLLFFGGNLYFNGILESQQLYTFQGYVGIAIFPLMMIPNIFIMYYQSDAALTRVREVIESAPDIKDIENPRSARDMKGDIEFKNVSFGYTPSTLVLKDISFSVQAGKKIAIIGTTGSGKSTIINLLPRFYDVMAGEILVDGVNVKEYELKEFRKQIGVVSQETFLFNKPVIDNIRFGRDDATLDEVIEVAKIADIHDFIDSLPDKYQAIVGERGTRLSGGQKQRLSIARALLIRPKILIFDDSTSSVDVETEYRIQKALEMFLDTTTFIITQRISTIRNADSILVLDKGRVVGLGNHDELLNKNPLYTQIYQTLYHKQSAAKEVPA